MSRYEDPEGTGENPAGGASGRSRRGRGRSDPWEPSGRPGKRAARSSQPPTRSRRILGRHPVVSILAILATLTITFVSLSAYAAYRSVYDSIHHVTVTSGELGKRPPKLNGSENILIIGSDSRNGTHGRFGRGIQGSRSDTSMMGSLTAELGRASFARTNKIPMNAERTKRILRVQHLTASPGDLKNPDQSVTVHGCVRGMTISRRPKIRASIE